MIRRLLKFFFAGWRESDSTWIPCRVFHREFEWSLRDPDKSTFPVASRILHIRSRDHAFEILIGVVDWESFSFLGPLLVLGPEFPLMPKVRLGQRIAFPGSGFVRYGIIHSALVQAIIQRCFNSRRRVKEVDSFGIPLGMADRIIDLCSRPVRELGEHLRQIKEDFPHPGSGH